MTSAASFIRSPLFAPFRPQIILSIPLYRKDIKILRSGKNAEH